MTTIDQRHRGRAIRKARRLNGPRAGVAFVTITPDTRAFEHAVADVMRLFERLGIIPRPRPQILHNGRKPS